MSQVRSLRVLPFLVILTFAPSAPSQTTVGVQKFGAYDGFPDIVDVGSLGLHLEIPLYNKAGRGSGTALTFTLTNYGGFPPSSFTSTDGTVHYTGLGPGISPGLVASGTLTNTPNTTQCRNMPGSGTFTDYIWTYVDGHGNSHLFPGYSQSVSDSNNTCSGSGITAYGLTALASDGSGYLITVGPGYFPTSITTPSGTVFTNLTNIGTSLVDSNGNSVSLIYPCTTSGLPCDDGSGNPVTPQIQDTVNSSIQVSGGIISADGQTRQPITIKYLDDSGNSQSISLNYKLYKDINGDAQLLDNVTYPDGSSYRFTYLLDSSGSIHNPVALASITLPSGGVISYTYPGGVQIISVNYGCPLNIPSLTRTTSDGTTTYTRTITSATNQCAWDSSYTQITKPNGDQTLGYFVMPQHQAAYQSSSGKVVIGWIPDGTKSFETKRLEYDHSNLGTPLRTTMRCYNGSTGDCTSTPVNEPVTELSVSTTLDNGLSSMVVTQYAGGSLPTEVDEYDFGATSPTRKTITTYASLGNNISDRPASVTVYDGAGNTVKKTTYAYDEVLPSPMTLPGHITVSGARGNPTSVYSWLNTTGAELLTKYVYDDAGKVTSVTDPMGNTTSYSYDSTTDAYQTKITRPTTNSVSHISTFGYGPNSGLVTSAYDENNQLTSYVYDSVFRPSSITYADGGETTFSYTPTSKTTNRLLQTGVWITDVELYDSYGRVSQTKLTTDPDCPGGDKKDTAYDSLGRVFTVSNPYCTTSDPTYGLTTYAYDALGRTTQVTHPDNSATLTTYTGRATQVQDEGNGTQRVTRISQNDALGRLLSICEVGPSSLIGSAGSPAACGQDISATGFLTTYQYDSLNNLLQVNQTGTAPRTFTYDSLSRLLAASNPESGSISYAYDGNGNLLTKTAPAPNQTGTATVTTNYQYDALNRLTQKSYNDGSTPTATYSYDVGCNPTYYHNQIGRLDASSIPSWSSCFGYDAVGRLAEKDEYTPQGLYRLPYTYNLVGNTTSEGAGYGLAYYGYNTAGRLTSVTSSYSDAHNPANVFSSVGNGSDTHYNALGQLTTNTLGNGEVETYSYDKRGRLQSYAASLSGSPLYSFNINSFAPNGDILSVNDTVNGNWTYAYDAFNRLTCSNLATNGSCATPTNGTPTYSYLYDRFGNRWQQNGPNSFLATFTGNNPGTPQNNNRMDGYTYDAAGNLLSDGLHSYVYDAENRIITVDSGRASVTLVQHASKDAGTTTSATLGFNLYNGEGDWIAVVIRAGHSGQTFTVTDSLGNSYHQAVQLNITVDTPNGDTLAIFYAENIAPGANTVTVTDTISGTLRLAILEYSGVAISNSLDVTASGQGTSASPNSGNATTTASGDLLIGAIATANAATYTPGSGYSTEESVPVEPNTKLIAEAQIQANAGTASSSATLGASDQWGAILATFKAGANAVFVYDADGHRVEKISSPTYDHSYQNKIFMYDQAGRFIQEFTPAFFQGNIYAGSRHLVRVGGWTSFIHSDWLGTRRFVYEINTPATQSCSSLPFGDGLTCTGSEPSPLHFTGKERDPESGLDNFGARYDSSSFGRFMSADQLGPGQHPGNPQSWNLYSYVLNNPLKLVDPSGEFTCDAKTVSDQQCDHFQEALDKAQDAADKLGEKYGWDSKQYLDAQRGIDAYGDEGVNNGVTIAQGDAGGAAADTGVAGNTVAKTADNPNGQNIWVTFDKSSNALGANTNDLAGLAAHEGVHVADGSDWVSSGFSPNAMPSLFQTEWDAHQVQASILEGLGAQVVTFVGPNRNYSAFLPLSPTSSTLSAYIKSQYPRYNQDAFQRNTKLPRPQP